MPPTRLADGAFVTVDRDGGVSVTRRRTVVHCGRETSQTIAGASASRNHLFVSTVTDLVTFDASTCFGWPDGGRSPPAIGSDGRVYTVAGDKLYIFQPAANLSQCPPGTEPTNGGPGGALPACRPVVVTH